MVSFICFIYLGAIKQNLKFKELEDVELRNITKEVLKGMPRLSKSREYANNEEDPRLTSDVNEEGIDEMCWRNLRKNSFFLSRTKSF